MRTCVRRRPENKSPQSRSPAAGSLVVRKSAPADPASRQLEVSILRRDVAPRGPPQTVSQPLRRRFGGPTNSFAATPATIRRRTWSRCALIATPLRITLGTKLIGWELGARSVRLPSNEGSDRRMSPPVRVRGGVAKVAQNWAISGHAGRHRTLVRTVPDESYFTLSLTGRMGYNHRRFLPPKGNSPD